MTLRFRGRFQKVPPPKPELNEASVQSAKRFANLGRRFSLVRALACRRPQVRQSSGPSMRGVSLVSCAVA